MKYLLNFIKDDKFKVSIIYTFIFGFIAHGYFYFNIFLTHDSTIFFQDDIKFQVEIGRFLQPLIFALRGNYYVPWLVGFLSTFFVALSAYMIIKILPIKSKTGIVLTCAILTTNSTLTCINATYSHDTDIYMLSLFFSILSVYLIRNTKKEWIFAPITIYISLGLYQSFLNVTVFLCMILIYIDLLNNKKLKEELRLGLKYIIAILAGLALYYIGTKISMIGLGVEPANSYNGIASVGKFKSINNIFKSIYITYKNVGKFFINPLGYSTNMMIISNIIIIICLIVMNIKIIIKNKIKKLELLSLIVLILFMPFGINVICFISQGMEHGLMIYSFFLIYIFAIYIMEKYMDIYKVKKDYIIKKDYKNFFTCGLIIRMLIIIIYNLCIYSNQSYYIKQNIYQNTLLTFNRIVYTIENLDNYEIGKTKVVFVGSLNESNLAKEYQNYNAKGPGTNSLFAVTYNETYKAFIKGSMHMNMNVLSGPQTNIYYNNNIVKSMKTYPSKDSIKIIDGVVVVKLSSIE